MRRTKRKRGTSPVLEQKEVTEGAEQNSKSISKHEKPKFVKPNPKEKKQQEEYQCWLMKSEPDTRIEKGMDMKFGIEDLMAQPSQTACWDGVRNYQARNFMRVMKIGQEAFFYHSNCKEPGIAGIVKIVKESYEDHTQFDPKNPHYDASSSPENPKWSMVDVQFVRKLKRYIPLAELKKLHLNDKSSGGPLRNIALFTRARLSVQPLTQDEFDFILKLEDQKEV
ncbi:thymocyte nuclear protein 1 isoform X2 [Xenopus laevis]|nr:thymocyte nuclear protein 1 isoform X2 [Xenopus laevis]XP_018081172.1 thymocyte nuclear protein 1 isoform X2 [Xenopus laevis]